ncbi:MAG: hypothetical protein JW885_02670 [Deltaproteobacteria bacterium]|nr:hypothetical protein [Candidatus Zymogenaceae bacterium]
MKLRLFYKLTVTYENEVIWEGYETEEVEIPKLDVEKHATEKWNTAYYVLGGEWLEHDELQVLFERILENHGDATFGGKIHKSAIVQTSKKERGYNYTVIGGEWIEEANNDDD